MARNFPANPQDGDTYEGYVYDASITAWTFPNPGTVAPVDPGAGASIAEIFKSVLFFGGN